MVLGARPGLESASMNGMPVGTPEAPHPEHHHFVQAPVRPLDEDGIAATITGTALFALVTVVLVIMRARLDAAGHGWWLWVGVTGVAVGGIGYLYCRRRAARGA